MAAVEAVPDTDAVPDEVETPSGQRAMKFDGIAIRDHSIVLTGLIDLDSEAGQSYKLGKTVKLVATGKVVSRKHSYKRDDDTGDKHVQHQVVVKIDWVEPSDA